MKIGPYEVVEELGRGGVGMVYRARSAAGEEVAIKVLAAGRDAPAQQRQRFAREARALQEVRHPNVVRLREVGEERGTPYLVLDYHAAGSLQSVLDRGGPLDVDTAEELGLQLASALGALHAQGVWHRDLKPGNVLITAHGTALLTDFGLVKDLGRLGRTAELTQTGTMLGTPGYAAPELAAGVEGDARSDVYGWGAVMYAALTGRAPIVGESLIEVLIATREQVPEPVRRRRPEVPGALDAVVMRCLAKDPGARWVSAVQLHGAWAEAVRGEAPGSATARGGVGRWILAALAVVLVAGGVGWLAGSAKRATVVAQATPATTPTTGPVAEAAPTPLPTPASTSTPGQTPAAKKKADEVVIGEATVRARERRDWKEVLRLADEGLRLRGVWPEMTYMRVLALWGQTRREKSFAEAWELIRSAPREVPYRVTLASMLNQAKDPTAGTRQLFIAWRTDPTLLNARNVDALIKGLLDWGRYRAGLEVVEAGLALDAGRWELRFVRASTLWRLGKRRKAVAGMREVAQAPDPDFAKQAKRNLEAFERTQVESLRRQVPKGDRALSGLIERARREVRAKQFDRGRATAEEGLRLRRAPVLLLALARCNLELGRRAAAEKAAREALRHALDPRDGAGACWLISLCGMSAKNIPQTYRFLNRAIGLNPSHLTALGMRAQIAFSRGYVDEAFEDAKRVLKLRPSDPTGMTLRGWGRIYSAEPMRALADFQRVLKAQPAPETVALAEEGRGFALVKLGQFDQAEPVLRRFLTRMPRRPRGLFARAELRWKRGDRAGAIADQQAGLRLMHIAHPERSRALRKLKMIQTRGG